MFIIILPLVLDTVWTSFIVFLAVYTLTLTFLTAKIALIIGILIGISAGFIFAVLYYKKLKKNYTSRKDAKQSADLLYTLPKLSAREKKTYAEKLISKSIPDLKCVKGGFYSQSADCFYYFLFTEGRVTADDILKIINGRERKMCFYLANAQKDVFAYFKNDSHISFIAGADLYKVAREFNLFPEKMYSKKVKQTAKQLAATLLKKENRRRYIYFGLFFLLFSFITPLKIYYAVAGFIFILLAFFSKFTTLAEKV